MLANQLTVTCQLQFTIFDSEDDGEDEDDADPDNYHQCASIPRTRRAQQDTPTSVAAYLCLPLPCDVDFA